MAQTVGHVMLDHMSSSGVMHGDGRRREEGEHEVKKKNIAAVHARYRDSWEGVDEVHAPELIEEYFQRKQNAVHTTVTPKH